MRIFKDVSVSFVILWAVFMAIFGVDVVGAIRSGAYDGIQLFTAWFVSTALIASYKTISTK